MQQFTKWLKILILFIFSLIFSNTLHAVDIKLIPNQNIIKVNGDLNNSTCHVGDIFRLRNTALFKNQPFDVLLKIMDEENEADTMISRPCISVNNNSNIVTRIRDGLDENGIDDSNTGAFMDIELTIVKQNTNTALTVDNIAFTAFDLDMINFFSLSDDIYLKSPSTGHVDANTSSVTLHAGDYFNGKYDILLQGISAPTANNPQGSCIDNPIQPDKACRASGLLSSSSVFEFRVSNDDARANEPDNHRSHRMFEISLQTGDFVGLGTDHGDMPLTYGDAFHDINLSFILGTNPADSEVAQYSDDANADDKNITDNNITIIDDEDAVSIVGVVSSGTEFNMTQGYAYELNITTSGGEAGYLKAWIDYNNNGIFDNDEMIIDNHIIAQSNTVYTIASVTIPDDSIVGKSYIRFRYSKDDNVAASGDGGLGEVEDYVVNIISASSLNGRVYNDKNGNGTQDVGEPGLANIRVTVTAENGKEQTITTDANGDYNVSVVAVGNAHIDIDEVTLPLGAKTITDTTTVLVEANQNNKATHGYQMQANLVTLKTVDNKTPEEGSVITYTISVTNNGPSQASNVTLTDKLPNGITYMSHIGNGTYNVNSGLWSIETIDNAQTEILQIKAMVNQNTSGNSIINVTTAALTPDQNDTTTSGDDLNETILISGKPLVTISDVQVDEGDDLIFDINLSTTSNFDTLIRISTAEGTAIKSSDYGDVNVTTVTILAGNLSTKVQVPSIEDTKYEGKIPETFTLNGLVTSGNTQNINPTATGTIVDDDTGVLHANDDEIKATVGDEVVVNVLENDISDIPLDPSTVKIINPETNTSVTELVVPGEGAWTVNPQTGSITFVPVDGFTGDPTPISYTVEDEEGTVSNPAEVSVDYAQGTISGIVYEDTNANGKQDSKEVGIQGVKVVITDVQDNNITLTTGTNGEYTIEVPVGNALIMIDETTLRTGNTQTEGTNPTTVIVSVNTVTRDVDGFAGVDAPKAVDDTVDNVQTGEPVTIDVLLNDTDIQNDIDPTSVQIVDTNGNSVTELVVSGEGTWSVDETNGKITFTPEDRFTGDPTPIQYTVKDMLGNTSNPASVTVDYAQAGPVAGDDNASSEVGDTVTMEVLTNDTDEQNDINKSTVSLIGPNGIEGVDTDDDGDGDELIIPNEGTWHVDENGVVTFIPISGYTDDPTSIGYVVSDDMGGISNEASISIDVKQVLHDDTGSGYIGDPISLNILTNDDTVNVSTVSLLGAIGSSGEDADADGDIEELVVPGEGACKVDNKGIFTFTPEATFSGNPTPITYTAQDSSGNILEAASITLKYSPAPRVTPIPTPKPHNVTASTEEPEVAFQNEPVAQDDNLTIYDESAHTSDVSLNDIFMLGDVFNMINPETSTLVSEGEVIRLKYGTVSMQADGKYTYTPYPETLTIDDYVEETFQYKISRATGESDMANVLVSLDCVCIQTSDADALDSMTMIMFIFMMGMLGLYFIGKEEITA